MESAYSTKVSQLCTKGSHHPNISLVVITQNVFHQGPSSRDISLNSKRIVVFKNPIDNTQIVTWLDNSTPKIFLPFTRRS